MKNLHTILYTMHDFNYNEKKAIDINDLLDKNSKYNNAISKLLDGVNFSPSDEAVNNILDFLKSNDY